MNKWYEQSGSDHDVVVSTRVRLARNLAEYPFPPRMSAEQRKEVNEAVKAVIFSAGDAVSGEFEYIDMESLSPDEAGAMVERHLISPQFAKKRAGKALIMTKDESVSIMLNEEDHIRIQVIKPGLAPTEALDLADKVDSMLDSALNYAFDSRLGYLTECPTNLGTGMRASLMLHLPLLEANGALESIAGAVSKIGLTVRGTYGEGSKALGSLYQFSNQVTLGISENDAAENLESIARQIIGQERALRANVSQEAKSLDKIWRSYGILTSARLLSGEECVKLLSTLRLGAALGIIPGVTTEQVGVLLHEAQPGMLRMKADKPLNPQERDIKRAELIRAALKQ
ncbi:MAG TPA: protein arginine kinase [Ruminococcaceae bacterium]|nr:protein arginine kinase [Oscillospiraceae bacterium]